MKWWVSLEWWGFFEDWWAVDGPSIVAPITGEDLSPCWREHVGVIIGQAFSLGLFKKVEQMKQLRGPLKKRFMETKEGRYLSSPIIMASISSLFVYLLCSAVTFLEYLVLFLAFDLVLVSSYLFLILIWLVSFEVGNWGR